MGSMKRLMALGAAALLLAAAASCGGDDDSGGDTASTSPVTTAEMPASDPTTTIASATTATVGGAPATSTPEGPATGEPILIGGMSPESAAQGNQPGVRPAMEAVAAYLNARGGINGRPIEIDFCDHKNDPNLLTQCTQDMVSKDVVALVGAFVNNPAYLPVLEQAGIASIEGAAVAGPQVMQSKISFPVASGALALAYGLADIAQTQGLSNLASVESALPATKPIGDAFKAAVALNHLTLDQSVTVPQTLTDLASVVAQADGSDATFLLLPPNQVLAYVQAAKQAGSTTTLLVSSGLLQQKFIDDTGGASSPAEGTLISDFYPAGADPAWDEFRVAIDEYDGDTKDIDLDNSVIKSVWVTMQVFAAVASTIDGDVTNASLLEALNGASDVEVPGLGLTLDFTTEFAAASSPRLFNRSIYPVTVKDGKFATLGDGTPIDTTKYFEAS